MRRLVRRLILSAGMFGYFGLGGAAMSWVVVPLATWGLRGEERRRRARGVVASGFKGFHGVLRRAGLVDYDPADVPLDDAPRPCVFVANHPTLIDTPALGAAIAEGCFFVRADFYRSALFGPLLRACGHIDAGDGATMAAASVIREAIARVEAGASLVVFPEGGRSPPGGMRRFRRGAFELACRAGVPVVPLYIRCDPPLLHRGMRWHQIPDVLVRYRVERWSAVDPKDFGGDARALARHVERLYRSRLAEGAAT